MNKKFYLTIDTETATLPCANWIAKNEKQKKNIAIAKPLVYDIGWVVTDRAGTILKKRNFLIQETFFVPSIFNTAYYANKRPKYLEMLDKGEIEVATWNQMIEYFLADLREVDISGAYNACFDFKKAIPFTETYIQKLYSNDFSRWEKEQEKICKKIASGFNSGKNDEFMTPEFNLRGENFPICDLWGLACEKLLDNELYKKFCLDNNRVTNSVQYFSTTAECAFQYLMKNNEFIESHTALDDAIIESRILSKLLKRGKVEPSITAFPFKTLGNTYDWAKNTRGINKRKKYLSMIHDKLEKYLETINNGTAYYSKTVNILEKIEYHLSELEEMNA